MNSAKITVFFLLLSSILFQACVQSSLGNAPTPAVSDTKKSKAHYRDVLREKREMLLVFGETNDITTDSYQEIVDQIADNRRFSLSFEVMPSKEVEASHLNDRIVFLVGTPESNHLIKKWGAGFPIKIDSVGFQLDEQSYQSDSDFFKFSHYPNPINDTLPIFCLGGNNDAAVLAFFKQKIEGEGLRYFWRSWDLEVYKENQRLVLANFNELDWTINPNQYFDYSKKGAVLFDSSRLKLVSKSVNLMDMPIATLTSKFFEKREEIEKFFEFKSTQTLECQLYGKLEEVGVKYGNMFFAQVDESASCVAMVYHPQFNGIHLNEDGRLLIREAAGIPQAHFLEDGLVAYFSDNWHGANFRHWAAKLAKADGLPVLKELFSNEHYDRGSRLTGPIAGASFVEFAISKWGKQAFINQYAEMQSVDLDLSTLEQEWRQFIEANYFDQPNASISASLQPQQSYFQGFNFAHEGYQVYNGYGSALAEKSIGYLRQMGSNAIAIVPYSFMREANQPAPFPFMTGANTENDESVIFAHFAAQSNGMKTMLKPQIWMRGGWPGDIKMESPEDWDAFFDYYTDWILHYALMAEMYQFDVFCVGVEFAQATIEQPDEWREIIRKVRQVYSGPLTYAANWGSEFESLSFWDELDYIGLDCYYPLSESEKPTRKELATNFDEVLRKAEAAAVQYEKPFLFTEIGFRSVMAPWQNPHAEANGRSVDVDAQKICYEVVFKGIQDKPWIKGIFLWKWPSYLDHTRAKSTGFTPHRKPAETIVSKHFKQTLSRQ